MSVPTDWRPEELLQFSAPGDGEVVLRVQRRCCCQHQPGARGKVKRYGLVGGSGRLCWIINQLHVPSLLPRKHTAPLVFWLHIHTLETVELKMVLFIKLKEKK